MVSLPFDQPGRFFRGNLHTHSTRSDGRLEPAAVVAAYRERGYDFLALTDHFLPHFDFPITDTRPFRTDDFTTILGAELHGPILKNGQRWHIVAAGLPLDFAHAGQDESGPSLAARAAAAGAFVGLAHPAWYGVTAEDAATVQAAHAIEVFNSGHAMDSDRGDGWYLCDLLLGQGRRLNAYAADDAHFGERPDSFGGWVQVRAESLDPDALLTALRAGHYYSSQGPELVDVRIADDHIHVACSPAVRIYAVGRGSLARSCRGEALTACAFPLAPFSEGYCRITVIDARGKRAWSNPFWLDGA